MTSYAETLTYEHAALLPSLRNVNLNRASRASKWHTRAGQALEAGRLCMSSYVWGKRPLAKERLSDEEETDDGLRFTSSQKFLSISPIVLYLLVSFYKKLWCCSLPHQHSLTAYHTATQVPWSSFISLASANTEGWGWDVGIKGCNIPPFSILSYLKSLRTIQPFPNSHWKPKLSQIFIGKWGSLGPALLGAGFFESGKTGEVRGKSLSYSRKPCLGSFLVD